MSVCIDYSKDFGTIQHETRVQISVSHFSIYDTFKRICDSKKLKSKQNYDTKNLWEKENLIKIIANVKNVTKR